MSRPVDVSKPERAASLDGTKSLPAAGLLQLAVSVVLLSSAWPLTKIALSLGSTPLWFAEGRAVLSGLTAALILALRGRLRVPHRADMPALFAIGVFQLGGYFALAHEAVAWVPAGRTAILANTTTIWVVPLSLIFLHEHIPLRRWLATGFGLAGVVVLMNPWAIDWTSRNVLVGTCVPAGCVAVVVGGDHRHAGRDAAHVDVRVAALVFCRRCGHAGAAVAVACTGWHAWHAAGIVGGAGVISA